MSFDDRSDQSINDERLTVAVLSDSCDAAGLRHQVLMERLAALARGTRLAGRARVIQFSPTLEDGGENPYDDAIDFIDSLNPGEVVVVATTGSNESAFWGELFSAAAIGRGAVGMITDGNVRDSARIEQLGFPAFSSSRRPVDFRGRMRVIATDQAAVICGVRFEPGDMVVADDDGVVVVPQAKEQTILALARQRISKETTVLGELLSGVALRTVWDRHRVL